MEGIRKGDMQALQVGRVARAVRSAYTAVCLICLFVSLTPDCLARR
jgi:hypothetical protein